MKDNLKRITKEVIPFIIIVAIVLLVKQFVITPVQVSGDSMYSTLKNGDIMILNKVGYKLAGLRRFQIVVVDNKDNLLIKRVIGLPGETVEYKDNKLYINGKYYEEDFIDTNTVKTEDFAVNGVIPEGKYLVLGDNRGNSEDSRDYGLISKKDIIGKAWIRFWPISQIKFIK